MQESRLPKEKKKRDVKYEERSAPSRRSKKKKGGHAGVKGKIV